MMANDYTGPERRREQRRKIADRRDLIRWEPDKADRRQGPGRRQSDQTQPYWRL